MSDKTRVLAALRAGDVRPSDFLPPNVVGKPIQRLAARVNDLRRDGYGIETVATRPTAVYRLVSSPSPLRSGQPQATNGAGVMGAPAPVKHAHVGIDLTADGLGPEIPACPPAWQRSGLNPMEDVAFGAGRYYDDEEGDDSWITEEAA
jgi:hypothetical protein